VNHLVFAPLGTQAQACRLRRTPARGGEQAEVVPLVSDIRQLEISRHPLHVALRRQLPQLHSRIRNLAARIGEVLPASLSLPPADGLPSWWETYSDTFARLYVAPAVINAEIARLATADGPPSSARLAGAAAMLPGAWHATVAALRAALQPSGITLSIAGSAAPRLFSSSLRCWASGAKRLSALGRRRRVDAAPVPEADVCCLAVGATSAPIIARLSQALQAHYGISVISADMSFGGSRGALVEHKLAFVDPAALAAQPAYAEAWRRHRALLFGRREIGSLLSRADLPAHLARGLAAPLQLAVLRDSAVGLYRIHCAAALLQRVQPKVILAFHPYADIISPYVLAAKRQGLKCLYLQHGILGPFTRTIGRLPYDKMMVFGDYVKELFGWWVDPGSEVVVTGHCLYDEAVVDSTPDPALRAQLLEGRKYLVLVITQPDEPQVRRAQQQWWLQGVAEACRQLDARAVLKLHPQESGDHLYRGLVQSFPDNVTVLAAGSSTLPRLISAADVVVMRDSTVAYEANLHGRLVITVNLSDQDERFPIARTGGALAVRSYGDISPTLRRALTDEATQRQMSARRAEFLRLHLGPLDGHATERICRHIAGAVAEVGVIPGA